MAETNETAQRAPVGVRVWSVARDDAADRDCMYGGEEHGCTHYRLTWQINHGNGVWTGGAAGEGSKSTMQFLADAANAAEPGPRSPQDRMLEVCRAIAEHRSLTLPEAAEILRRELTDAGYVRREVRG